MNNQKKILIVEDEISLLSAIEKKLKIEGYQTITAVNGEEGLEKIKNEKPDLVLLDILMPKIDGMEVLRILNKEGILPGLPVIIISNSGQPVEIEKTLELGIRDYLVKANFDPEEVVQKVNSIINKENNKNENKSEIKKTKILIIEDDQLLLDLCSTKLRKDGFDVDIAIDANTGMEKIKQKPNLILLDIILPGINGFELLEKIKNDPDKELSQIPVIILSNLGQESDVQRGISLGAKDYLVKASVTTDEISAKIKKILFG